MDCLQKVYPSAEDLSKIVTTLYCTEEGCSSVFTSKSNLNLHLVKTHKKTHLLSSDNSKKAFHCPEISCIYNNSLYFKNMKLLKQHYLKVHTEKSFLCDKCNLGFPTPAAKRSHSDYCGVIFKCCDCDASYPCYESLITHSRRKKHVILDKKQYKEKSSNICLNDKLEVSKSDTCIVKKQMTLLPKSSSTHALIIPVKLISGEYKTIDKSSQTECNFPKLKSKRTQVTRDATGKHNSQQTQTSVNGKLQTCVETQTVGDYIKNSTETNENRRKHIKTQTKLVTSLTKSCNTSFNMNDFTFVHENDIQRTSSGTQTCVVPTELIYSTSMTSTHDSIPTDTSDLNMEFIKTNDNMNIFDSTTFYNCNTETQTDLFGDLFNCYEYYNNTHTQTCDDILLNSMIFNDTQTQTILDDMLRSVESQTMMSHSKKNLMTCHDMAHMETQTDNEFKQMLEEINA